jgi:flagellar hook assembly protein FlgD
MLEATVLNINNTYLTRPDDPGAMPLPADFSFTIPSRVNTASNATVVLPEVQTDFAFGTSLLDIQVLTTDSNNSSSLGSIVDFPTKYVPRGQSWWDWNGQLSDGSFAPGGTYKFLVKALHIFGDASTDSDYDVAETVSFRIQYA